MRRNFIAQIAGFCRRAVAKLLVQQAQLRLQAVQLLLLTYDGLVQRLDYVLRESELGFEFVQTLFQHLSAPVMLRVEFMGPTAWES